jgi:erythromycin esterase-like protein
MWRNTDVLDFIGWLRNWNDSVKDHHRKGHYEGKFEAGFYGLDLYSLNASARAVIDSLEKIDPVAARRVAEKYACFDHYDNDTQRYGLLAGQEMTEGCRQQVMAALMELHGKKDSYLGRDGVKAKDEFFNADQNARLVHDAEEYYRTMFRHDVSSWNLRDRHMMQTLLLLMHHLQQTHLRAKVVIWAHNSHLGNAAATSMGARGEFNIGQLVRDHFDKGALSIGFTTHHGTVTASSDWDAPAERKRVRNALPESYEHLFHETGVSNFWLDCHADPEVEAMLRNTRIERAIGVIYRPDTEKQSHYFRSSLPDQFDGILHYDVTRAVEPLERTVKWVAGEVDETYPSGL